MKKSNLLFLTVVTVALLAVYGFNGQFNKPGDQWRDIYPPTKCLS
ncbi:MAG: hypothetical protein V3V99_04660 [candidate division Zixibacteria bacterium]